MGKSNAPLMEVDLHRLVHKRWPWPIFMKIEIDNQDFQTVAELFLKEGKSPRSEKSHFWISVYYEFQGFSYIPVSDSHEVVFAVNKNVLCMFVDECQELSLKDNSLATLETLKAITKTVGAVSISIPLVESMPMPRISNENGSRGAVVEDVYWRIAKK